MLVEKCLNSEEEEFQEISNQFKDIGEVIENGCYEQVFQRIIYMNQLLSSICNHYSTRHNTESAVFDVNLTNSLNLRNLLLYNVLYVIGPIIFSSDKNINWSFFSSSLEIKETILQSGYQMIPTFFSQDDVSFIVKTSLSTGFIEDFEITGIVYSISYFIQFILKVEEDHLPYSTCVDFFYSHISSYSYPLLITSIISIQHTNQTKENWIIQGISHLMSYLGMQPKGVEGIINTYLSFSEGADMDAIIKVAKGIATCHSSIQHDLYYQSILSQILSLFHQKSVNQYIITTCCYILYYILLLQPSFYYYFFFSKAFSCYLLFIQQPYYRSISISSQDIPSLPILAETISQSNLVLLRFCQFGGNLISLFNSISILISPLFQFYQFALSYKLSVTPVLSKILQFFLQHNPYSVKVCLSLLQDNHSSSYKFALNGDGQVEIQPIEVKAGVVDKAKTEAETDTEEESISQQIDSVLKLLTTCGNSDICSDFFVELISLILPSSLELSSSYSLPFRNTILLTITKIVNQDYGSQFFQFDILKALRVIEKMFTSIASYPEVRKVDNTSENNHSISEEVNKDYSMKPSFSTEDLFFIQSSLTLINQLLESIASQTITLPKVIDIQHEKEMKAHKKNAQQLQTESEYQYKQKLLQVTQRLSQDNNHYTSLFDKSLQQSIHNHLQSLYQQVQSLIVSPSSSSSPTVSSLTKEVQSIIKEVKSAYPAMRAMGLSRFDELVRFASDDELKPILPRLFTLLQTCLNDEDPAVSLASINAYMILGTRYYDKVLPILLKLIGNTTAPFDLRIRGIESVVCIIHYMNTSSFKFADSVVNTLLFYMDKKNSLSWQSIELKKKIQGTAEDEVKTIQLIRASCFSALAEVTSQVIYGIEKHLPEILSHCKGVIMFEQKDESAVEVRRGVGFLVYRLIEATMDKPSIELNDIDLIIMRGLNDPDDIVTGHFRKCSDLWKEQSTSIHPLIEELLNVY